MSGKRPAVVKRPDHGDVLFLQITEQHPGMQIASVDVVQVNHIGRKALDLPDEPAGAGGVETGVGVKQLCDQAVEPAMGHGQGFVSHVLRFGRHIVGAAANHALAAVFFHQPADFHSDSASAFDAANRVQLKDSHGPPPYCRKSIRRCPCARRFLFSVTKACALPAFACASSG